MSRTLRTQLWLCSSVALLSSCLTTPAADSGWTKRARDLSPGACTSDALIEDGGGGDNQILKRAGRGY